MSRLFYLAAFLPLAAFAVDYGQELADTRDRISRHEANLHLANSLQDRMRDSLRDYGNPGVASISELRDKLQLTKEQMEQARTSMAQVEDRISAALPAVVAAVRQLYQFDHSVFWSQLISGFTDDARLHRVAIVDEYIHIASGEVLRNYRNQESLRSYLLQVYQQQHALAQQQESQLMATLQQHIAQKNSSARYAERLQKVVQESQATLDKLYQAELRLLAKVHGRYSEDKHYAANQLLRPAFAQQKGKLPWPVQGKVRKSNSRVDWSGVFIDHKPGQPVLAVSPGRVVFANSLEPIGNMVILDHGDGFMSLYAHDASISRRPGDWVAGGDIIASVDNTGEGTDSVLYFEIRHHGNPLNPALWCN